MTSAGDSEVASNPCRQMHDSLDRGGNSYFSTLNDLKEKRGKFTVRVDLKVGFVLGILIAVLGIV